MARSAPGPAAPRLPRELTPLATVELDDDTELDGVELRGVTFASDEPSGVAISGSRLVGVSLTAPTSRS
jgi:hypothetical protein